MSHNNRIENNNIDLQAILNIVKNLPEESGGSGGFYNGTKWTQSNITSDSFYSIHNANGVWVAGSYRKGLYYSVSWEAGT